MAVERFAAGLRAVLVRAAPIPDCLARLPVDFFALLLFAVDDLAVERLAAVLRTPLFLAAPPLRPVDDDPELVLAVASIDHLPDMTR